MIKSELIESSEYERIKSYMDAGTEIRNHTNRGDILALSIVADIHSKRPNNNNHKEKWKRTAHIVKSLKHPDEVRMLRDIWIRVLFSRSF